MIIKKDMLIGTALGLVLGRGVPILSVAKGGNWIDLRKPIRLPLSRRQPLPKLIPPPLDTKHVRTRI